MQDCGHYNYNGAPSDGSAWTGTDATCEMRVQRDGSWVFIANFMRSAHRFQNASHARNFIAGFRLAQDK